MEQRKYSFQQGYFVVAMEFAGFTWEQICAAAEMIHYPLDNDRNDNNIKSFDKQLEKSDNSL